MTRPARRCRGAQVVVGNAAISVSRKFVSNDSGQFPVRSLPARSGYEVAVTEAGFAGFEAQRVTLQVGHKVVPAVRVDVAQ